jgi:transcriptional regulator NrdR family protein
LAKKSKSLNLDLSRIDPEKLSEIIEAVEKEVRSFLDQTLPPKSEYDLVLSLENDGEKISFLIDISVYGGYSDITDYDRIVGDAINIARKRLEEELRKYSRGKEASK